MNNLYIQDTYINSCYVTATNTEYIKYSNNVNNIYGY